MQIHVVQSGQTLSGIAEAYGTTAEDIVRANKLPNPDKLVVGQALVIPIVGRFYWVQRGDTLWSIARRFSIPMQRLAEVNRLSLNAPLKVGQRLYIPPGAKRRAEFNAYIEPRGATVSPALEASAREAAPYLTYLSPFYFAIRRDATLQEPPLDDFPDIARANRVTLVMVVANIENGQFSDELGALMLTNETLQNRLLDNIVATARRYGFRDIHFDFEYLRPEDREAYNAFLRKAKRRFAREGWMMSTALAPKTSATQRGRWYEAHDYRAHGQIVDFVVIMTYEWGYSGG
ncbi:LysM peptidoglycan-binding domain-containing protein, partial [Geobacillus sp. ZGt-1]